MITTAEQRVDMERHRAVHEAMNWVKAGIPSLAVTILLDSIHRQARWTPHGAGYEARVRHLYVWPPPDPIFELPARTCFDCGHYTESYCRLFAEQIDSELFSARDCDGFEAS